MGLDLSIYKILPGDQHFIVSRRYPKVPVAITKHATLTQKTIDDDGWDYDWLMEQLGLDPETEFLDWNDDTRRFEKTVDVYVFNRKEVAYQRKGLNKRGQELLDESYNSLYLDDKQLVETLVREGGLSQEFLDVWVDGETMFVASW
jgi:hypothetical protein